MGLGPTIEVFLVDGLAGGLRTIELSNWSGMALACPRTDLVKLLKRDEAKKTGIYILSGYDSSVPGLHVYIGESDDVATRLKNHDHDPKKDFWQTTTFFVSKDHNLTKAHVLYVEARLITEALLAKRCYLHNGTQPIPGGLPESGKATMEVFTQNLKLILETLGIDIFQPHVAASPPRVPTPGVAQTASPSTSPLGGTSTTSPSTASSGVPSTTAPGTSLSGMGQPVSPGPQFYMDVKGCHAEAWEQAGKFIVTTGSTGCLDEARSIQSGTKVVRDDLRTRGILQVDSGKLRFTQDWIFNSSSTAAKVIAGANISGPANWKVIGTKQTYGAWRDSLLSPP